MPKGLKESFAAFAKSNRLSELESIFNEITITEQKCNTQLEECRQHKVRKMSLGSISHSNLLYVVESGLQKYVREPSGNYELRDGVRNPLGAAQ